MVEIFFVLICLAFLYGECRLGKWFFDRFIERTGAFKEVDARARAWWRRVVPAHIGISLLWLVLGRSLDGWKFWTVHMLGATCVAIFICLWINKATSDKEAKNALPPKEKGAEAKKEKPHH